VRHPPLAVPADGAITRRPCVGRQTSANDSAFSSPPSRPRSGELKRLRFTQAVLARRRFSTRPLPTPRCSRWPRPSSKGPRRRRVGPKHRRPITRRSSQLAVQFRVRRRFNESNLHPARRPTVETVNAAKLTDGDGVHRLQACPWRREPASMSDIVSYCLSASNPVAAARCVSIERCVPRF